jgi:RND family efflux transporter MFP subunit
MKVSKFGIWVFLMASFVGVGSVNAGSSMAIKEDVRVLITAKQHAILAGQINGRVIEVARKEGEKFRSGDVLVRFDCRLYASELDRARLEVDSAAKVVEAKKTLSKLDSGSRLELDLAKNDLAIAEAVLKGKTSIVDYCVVTAPFDGSVVERFVENHEYRRIGEQLLSIQEDKTLTSEILVPAHFMPRLTLGQTFPVRIDDLDSIVTMRLVRLGGSVDAVSQTVKLYGEVVQRPLRLLPGMIGTATLGAVPVEQKARELQELYPVEALAVLHPYPEGSVRNLGH